MEFNASTFVLEIINFLVLIWILQRLFYKPLLAAITKRRQFIDQTLTDAKALQDNADAQRSHYEDRLKLWEQEKQTAFTTLQQQLETEKKRQLDLLNQQLEQEKQKAKVTLEHLQKQLTEQAERQGLQNAARFAGLLLQQAASPELEHKLCQLLLEQWTSLPEACNGYLQNLNEKKSLPITVTSVFGLPPELQNQLEQKLNALTAKTIHINYLQDPQLLAGLKVDLGYWVLNANLQHELFGFAEIAHVGE